MPKILFLPAHAPVSSIVGTVGKKEHLGLVDRVFLMLWYQVSTRVIGPLRAPQQAFRAFLACWKQFPQVLRHLRFCEGENAGKGKTTIFPAEKKYVNKFRCYKQDVNVTTSKSHWTSFAADV
ncbi:hypothetical protein [Herbaspirillum sp.]|uniref:hypothetical protein n=1 Tax=Herbaspirillum sp. TaxID=1890675 RepID=UPI0031D8CD89